MEKRAAVIRALEAKKEEQRRAAEKEHALTLREQSKPISIDLKRKAEVADTLKHSVVDITSLQVVSASFVLLTSQDPRYADHASVDDIHPFCNLVSLSSSKRQRPTNRPSSSSACEPCLYDGASMSSHSCIYIAADSATCIPFAHATTHCLVLASSCVLQCLHPLISTYLRLGSCLHDGFST